MRNDHNYRRGALLLGRFVLGGSVKTWSKYLDIAYPGSKPADWDAYLAALPANLSEPGRMQAAQNGRGESDVEGSGRAPGDVRCRALVVMGADDSDFPDPEAEAAGIVKTLPADVGRYEMIGCAGHYPHAEYPQQVADAILPFLAEHEDQRT